MTSKFKVGDKVVNTVGQSGAQGQYDIGELKGIVTAIDGICMSVNNDCDDDPLFAQSAFEFCVEDEYTGGSSDYYKVLVKNPTTLSSPYEAECNDIIESLNMTFAEGNAFKAIWRKAKARQGVRKKGYDNGVYDSEKVVFFGERMLVEAKSND
ncbi:hypothetical protein D3C85_378090 [compost metagenome]